jgi:polar amino acid transport system substrate-binding protein
MRGTVALGGFVLVALLGIASTSTAGLPRDPEQTLEHVKGGRMRVALVEHPPWVVRTNGEPAGAEVELVRELAKELGAKPEWHWGGEQQQLEALERYELDLVIGGLTDDTPWSKTIGLTSPYFENRIVVGVPRTSTRPQKIKGMQIAAAEGEAVAAYIERKGAAAIRVRSLKEAQGAIAAPEWQVEQLGLATTNIELLNESHVMAAPPGENGWIAKLDEFLHARRNQVKQLLQKQNHDE